MNTWRLGGPDARADRPQLGLVRSVVHPVVIGALRLIARTKLAASVQFSIFKLRLRRATGFAPRCLLLLSMYVSEYARIHLLT